MKPGVFITIDVECSMGGAFENPSARPVPPSRAMLGEYAGRRMGTPLITEILGEHGLAATFFVDPFAEEQGYPGAAEPVVAELLDGGQDVQLHIHPCHEFYAHHARGEPYPRTDDFAALEPSVQRDLLGTGVERLAGWTGQRPAALRTGNMSSSEEMLPRLREAGLRIDSSYTFPYAGTRCHFDGTPHYNGSRWYGEVLELALSGFRLPRFPGLHRVKPVDLVGISFGECRDAVQRICTAGADAVLILHSFSLFKVRDLQYSGGRPDRIVTSRLRRLCRWLAEVAEEMPTVTFSQLGRAVDEGQYEARAAAPPTLGLPRAVLRKAVQAVNRAYWI